MQQRSGKRVEVYLEQGPVTVQSVTPPLRVELDNGVTLEERFFGGPSASANFRLTASKEVFNVSEVHPTYEVLEETMETLRLIWPFAGGSRVEGPIVSNHERIFREFLAEQGKGHISSSWSLPVEWGSTYEGMPLSKAVSLLRKLGKLPGDRTPREDRDSLWLCIEWYEMATIARRPLDKFMKAFPPLDLLASTHHQEAYQRSQEVEEVLGQIKKIIDDNRSILGERTARALRSKLMEELSLRDMFEHFLNQRFPAEANQLADAFARLNKIRNEIFHEARHEAIDREGAETACRLLYKSLRGTLEQ
jgi:hypothetical protein